QLAMVVTLAAYLAELVPDLNRALPGVDGRGPAVDQRERVGVPVVDLGQGAAVLARDVPKGALVLRDRLAVGAEVGGAPSGARRIAAHELRFTGGVGVVGESGLVVALVLEQRIEQGPVSGEPTVRWHLGLDGPSRQLVPETKRVTLGAQQA